MSEVKQPFRRILVATDFSPHADAALKQAIWLARQSGAKLTLAHTLPDLRSALHASSYQAQIDLLHGEGDLFQREIRQSSDSKMRRLIADLNAVDLNITFETLLGTAFIQITRAVQQEGYDLVLAGTRGLAAWKQFFVGSTATRLIRKCPAAMWIVKAEHVGPPKVVLASTDFSDVSRKAVLQGFWLAGQANADFHLLHVIDSADVPEDLLDQKSPDRPLRQQINDQANRRLKEFVDSLDTDYSRIQLHLTWGTPWQEIGRLAQHLQVDLITMGTVGRSGIKGVLLGNTAEKVLNTSDCSILTVKPDGFVSPIDPPIWPLHPGVASETTSPPNPHGQ